MAIQVYCESVVSLAPVSSCYGSYRPLLMEVTMTNSQMRQALYEFLSQITDAEWHCWLQEISPELLKDDGNDNYKSVL